MKIIRLETLQLDVPAPDTINYFYDGEIADYQAYRRKMNRRYNGQAFNPKKATDKKFKVGFCIAPQNDLGGIDIRTSIITFFGKRAKIFLRGHEETHALEYMEGQKLLERKLNKTTYQGPRWIKLKEDLRADIGGLYSLVISDVSLKNEKNWDDIFSEFNYSHHKILINKRPPIEIFREYFAA